MRHVETITEEAVVAHFLKTEIESVRFREEILERLARDGWARRVLDAPDVGSAEENAYRARLLGEFRGYRRGEGIFTEVPDAVAWHRYALSRAEVARIRYIDYSFWNVLSGGTRRAIDAAPNIRAGIVVFGQSMEWALGLAREVERGAVFPEMILVAPREGVELTVLEGHARLTAYCLALEHVPEPLTAIVGFGEGMERV